MTPGDDEPAEPDGPVAVISHRFWRDRLGGRDEAVGEAMTIDGTRVTIVGVALNPPIVGGLTGDLVVSAPGTVPQPDAERIPQFDSITPGWFAGYRIPIERGRDFDERDRIGAPPVMPLNDALVRRLFPGRDVVGMPLAMTFRFATGDSHMKSAPSWASPATRFSAHSRPRGRRRRSDRWRGASSSSSKNRSPPVHRTRAFERATLKFAYGTSARCGAMRHGTGPKPLSSRAGPQIATRWAVIWFRGQLSVPPGSLAATTSRFRFLITVIRSAGVCRAMLFNTSEYFFFFSTVLLVYFALPFRAQNLWLLLASYFFYGSWDWRFLSLLLLSTVIDYAAGLAIHVARERDNRRTMKIALTASVGGQLAILAFFKYFNFFAESAASLLSSLGFYPSLPALNVILPVGISFYTFQTMSYTIDIYRGHFLPTRRFVDFALSVAFFPHLVAGPIQRARSLIVQIERPRVITQDYWERGLTLLAIGLVRKVAIADPAGMLADTYFSNPAGYASIPLACGALLVRVADLQRLRGIQRDGARFGQPDGLRPHAQLQAPVLCQEHLRVLDPLAHLVVDVAARLPLHPVRGNRKGTRRTYVNLMLTMLLGGLWHGASWNFVMWGGLHGSYLVGYHAWTHRSSMRGVPADPDAVRTRLAGFGSAVVVYLLVTFTWLFFRSHDTATTIAYLSGLFALRGGFEGAVLPVLALAAFTLAIDVPQALADDECRVLQWHPLPRAALVTAGLVLLLFSGNLVHEAFIYFQF